MHDLPQSMRKTPQTVRVAMAGKVEFIQAEEVRPHQHATWELVYCLECRIRCPSGHEVYDAHPGVLLLTPPHMLHYEICPTAWACFYVLIEDPADHPWPRVYHDDGNRTVLGMVSLLAREWHSVERDRTEMLALLMRQLDILFQRTYVEDRLSPAERLVREVERRLEEHCAGSVTIKDLAREVGVSQSYLRVQFTRLRGQTPMAYLQALRVRHALALIPNSNLSLEAIANRCGYSSASHLSRSLKQATGKRPGSFRKC